MDKPSPHFEGKDPLSHVVEARKKGQFAAAEIHGTEPPGSIQAATDAMKEGTILFFLLFQLPFFSLWTTFAFFSGWLLWRTGRSAFLGWTRLERLHKTIEEERWEIEHHRPQEKEELRALYAAKGFSGKLLDEVIDVLMADENRLLQVMLEEELGLRLESFEHPLQQALGAFLGGFVALLSLFLSFFYLPFSATLTIGVLLLGGASRLSSSWAKTRTSHALIWTAAIALLGLFTTHFLLQV